MVNITMNGLEYPLATSLRVAYAIQGQHNHKPYSKIFQEIGDMTLEQQIAVLFCAFKIANPQETITQAAFLAYFLDNYKLKAVLDLLKDLISEIMGADLDEMAKEPETSAEPVVAAPAEDTLDLGPKGN